MSTDTLKVREDISKILSGFRILSEWDGGVGDRARILPVLKQLNFVCGQDRDEREILAILNDPDVDAIGPMLRQHMARSERLLERGYADEFKARRSLDEVFLAKYPLFKDLFGLISQEQQTLKGQMANSEQTSRIAVLGSPYLPITAITMCRRMGVAIDFIEKDKEACEYGHAVADKLRLADKINMITCDWINHDFSPYLVVVVSAQIANKAALLKHLDKYKNIRYVILRHSEGLGSLCYERVEVDRFPHSYLPTTMPLFADNIAQVSQIVEHSSSYNLNPSLEPWQFTKLTPFSWQVDVLNSCRVFKNPMSQNAMEYRFARGQYSGPLGRR